MQLLNTTFGGIMSDICKNWSTWLKKTRFSYMDENQIQQTLNWLTNIKNIVLDMADLKENQKVADFGCGSGLLGFGVLERFEDKIELIFSDKFQDCLDECKNILNNSKIKSNVKFLKSDILNIKLENDYLDRALTRSVLVHVLDKQQAFSELFRVLKPNGMYCAFEPIISQNTRYYELLIPDEASDYFDFKKAEMEFMTNLNDPLVNFSAQSLDLNMQMAGFNNVVVNVQKVVSKYSPTIKTIENWFITPPAPNQKTMKERFMEYFDENKVNKYIEEVKFALSRREIRVCSDTALIRAIK